MTAFQTDVPPHPFDIVVVRPTRDSMTVSVVAYSDEEGAIEYWPQGQSVTTATPVQPLPAGRPVLFLLPSLRSDAAYQYRLKHRARPAGQGDHQAPQQAESFVRSEEFGFHTPRPSGSPFTFTIIADSHLDANMTPAVYERALVSALSDKPDFHIDLGDTFMTDKRGKDFKSALPQYIAQRYYFGKLCCSAPLFMVLGNHDGEWGYARGDADAMAPWSFAQRSRFFPPPEIVDGADGKAMYSGCTTCTGGQGANYYAFTWGDALFIVLDPFWFTDEKARGPGGRGGGDKGVRGGEGANGGRPADDADTTLTDQGWLMTLGRPQYNWLARTLEASQSKFRFVFIHHLVGGLGRSSRGGIAAAPYFEWGGKNADASDGFAMHRAGWAMPIHQLLVKHHVSAVFHGHDHLFVHEELDGITYQCVPQPGNPRGGTRSAPDYGYSTGTILGSPGYLRVNVGPAAAEVAYLGTGIGAAPGDSRRPVESAHRVNSYQISPFGARRETR